MNANDVLTNAIDMMDKVQNKAKELKKKLDEVLTLTRRYRQYIETFHPEIHDNAVEYIKENNY